MFRTIIVPLDGSRVAEQALPIAIELARRAGAHLTLVRVHQPPVLALSRSYEWDGEIRERESSYLNQVAAHAGGSLDTAPDVQLLDGHVPDAIRAAAKEHDAPLIVMTSHGLTGFSRYWIGSVADEVIRRAHTPVLMVRAREAYDAQPATTIHGILVPLDGSTMAEAILPYALSLAKAMDARLELFRVVEPSHMAEVPWVADIQESDEERRREAESQLRAIVDTLGAEASGRRIDVRVTLAASPARTIATHARAHEFELVAMTTTASGLARLVGSVADKVIRHGPPMVLLVRPGAAE